MKEVKTEGGRGTRDKNGDAAAAHEKDKEEDDYYCNGRAEADDVDVMIMIRC